MGIEHVCSVVNCGDPAVGKLSRVDGSKAFVCQNHLRTVLLRNGDVLEIFQNVPAIEAGEDGRETQPYPRQDDTDKHYVVECSRATRWPNEE